MPFETKDISEDENAMNDLVKLGSTSVPTILVDEKVFIGFNANQLAKALSIQPK